MTPSIAEDIQMLVNFCLEMTSKSYEQMRETQRAAERVEAYLSSFKPDHL